MLKRPRPRSSSPFRPDPSAPPLDNTALMPFRDVKRRRTTGPVLSSHERRAREGSPDDGEDDCQYEDSFIETQKQAENCATQDKIYEHVNHVLHRLHAEQLHRSRTPSAKTPSRSQIQVSNPYLEYSSRMSSSDECLQTDSTSYLTPSREGVALLDTMEQYRSGVNVKDGSLSVQDDERLRVTQRYEDINRLLRSLVLSRRSTLQTPPPGIQ